MIPYLEMDAPQFLGVFLSQWQAGLPERYAPLMDGFLRRQRGVLGVLVQRALARQRAERGLLPDSVAEFAAYDPVVRQARSLDAQSDAAVLGQLRIHVEARVAGGRDPERYILAVFADDFVNARTEAILLRRAGWDVVPLMLRRPAIAVTLQRAVVAVRDNQGRLATHPLKPGALNHLRADIDKAEIRTLYLRDEVINKDEVTPNLSSLEALLRFAGALWALARKPAPDWVATPRRRTPS